MFTLTTVQTLKLAAAVFVLWLLKTYFGGARNTAERNMHSRVVLITGGTSGIGAAVARGLAQRGAQLVLLTQHSLTDPFLVDYIMDLRAQTSNELITAEQADLSSLHSIRQFATKWIDNAPPRRLDMIVLCANTMTPRGGKVKTSVDGVEETFAVNYLANFQLLSILSPAIRAQPPDREVRILFGTCASYMGGRIAETVPLPNISKTKNAKDKLSQTSTTAYTSPAADYASSKLALMTFAQAFKKHLIGHSRPDQHPMNARIYMVDPGWCRTPGMRRHITFGSLWGLVLYLAMWPLWWLVLKSSEQGAETFLHAAMESGLSRGEGGQLVKECQEAKVYRDEIFDETKQKKLWEVSEKAIEILEKDGALRRATEKQEKEEAEKAAQRAVTKERQPGSRRSRKAVDQA